MADILFQEEIDYLLDFCEENPNNLKFKIEGNEYIYNSFELIQDKIKLYFTDKEFEISLEIKRK